MKEIISVKNLGKKYIISHQGDSNDTFREMITNNVKKIFKGDFKRSTREEFWAIKEVTFDIKKGERIGIIGRNGAGKSTFLKLLSRITEPSEGKIKIKGKISSLLEVGTGFHPELTGRENIFLNGATLGMSRNDIKRKFNDIVEFSEIEKFLDTPVKRYSSGMYVRLAFAIAAHLEPDILLVDEVLAVGDAEFQKKSLGKMEDVSNKEGRTIIFVSHNMAAIKRLCNRVILLKKGKLIKDSANLGNVINYYLSGENFKENSSEWINSKNDFKNQYVRLFRIFISDLKGNKFEGPISANSDIWLNIELEIIKYDPALQIGYALISSEGELIYWSFHTDINENILKIKSTGKYIFKTKISKKFLNEGIYRIELGASLYSRLWIMEPGKNSPWILLEIRGDLSDSPYWVTKRPGILAPSNEWIINKVQ